MGAVICSRQIHSEMALPHRLVSFNKGCGFDNAGVVYQNIRLAPELLLCPSKRSRNAIGISDVAFGRDRFSSECFKDIRSYSLDFLARARSYDDIGPFARKSNRDRATNAATAASDERESVCEIH